MDNILSEMIKKRNIDIEINDPTKTKKVNFDIQENNDNDLIFLNKLKKQNNTNDTNDTNDINDINDINY